MIEKAAASPTPEIVVSGGNNPNFTNMSSGSLSSLDTAPKSTQTQRGLVGRRTFLGMLAGAIGVTAFGVGEEKASADGGIGSSGFKPEAPIEPKPPVPNSFNPAVEPTGFGEDPVSRSEIERRKLSILPPRWREKYEGKLDKDDKDRQETAQALYNETLAIAMGYEGGGLATDARELNEKTSSQYDLKKNTVNGFIKRRDFGSKGISQIFVVAPHDLSLVNLDTPISLIRGVEKIITDNGREIFSFNNGVVIGKSEIDPKDLARLVQSVTYVNEAITWGDKILDKELIENPGVSIDELIFLVKDANSKFNLDIKSQALKAALETAHALQTASPDHWNINPGFAATLEGYRQVLPNGEEAVLEYTRSKSFA
jgi:hypothetical protein